jgi:2-oxo-3-hexenedioate decarboxylase
MTAPTSPIAAATLLASAERRSIVPFSDADPSFDLPAAYRVTAQVRAAREARGERVVGRKVGFTNRTIWDEYGVHAPIWGYVYDSTLRMGAPSLAVGHLAEPRIEPEIVLGLARAPEPGMDEAALMGCVGWVAHGFEIVQSLFPGWRFRAPDTVAAYALHGALVVGEPAPVENADAWRAALRGFGIALACDGEVRDEGRSENVLGGGPIAALAHLVAVLAADPASPALQAGEIVSTGTLTRALPIRAGETWTTRLDGLPLPGMTLAIA